MKTQKNKNQEAKEDFGLKAKTPTDKVATDKVAADKVAADKIAADKIAADKIAADRIAAKDEVLEEEHRKIKSAQTGSYLPDQKERHLFHAQLDRPLFDKKTGEKLSKSFMQKFTEPEWGQFKKGAKGLGYDIEVMWNPKKYK